MHTVRAKQMVVVSAGTLNTPLILERSGIGSKSVLEKNGVAQLVDLPGVGENFQGTHLVRSRSMSISFDGNYQITLLHHLSASPVKILIH